MMNRRKARVLALIASFFVYLIPLAGPHATWFLGLTLLHGWERRLFGLAVANCGVAILVQIAAAASLYWFLRRPGWRRAGALLPGFAIGIVSLQWLYLVAIPRKFLEEPDKAAENVSWPPVCIAAGVSQTNLRAGSELWVRSNTAPNEYSVLAMPECRIAPVKLPQPAYRPGSGVDFMLELTSVAGGRRAIVRKYVTKEARASWWLAEEDSRGDTSLTPLEEPAGHSTAEGGPILSTDGLWIAWLDAIRDNGRIVSRRALLRPARGREAKQAVNLGALGTGSYSLYGLDMRSRELLLWKTDRLIGVDLDGNSRKEFGRPATARSHQNTYLRIGAHWLAWDAYREDEHYAVEWSLPAGSGVHRVPLGRSIHSAAVDPAGRWIAVSVGRALSIGEARDAVYVLRASDGVEVFRKYLPAYTRTEVGFLDGGFFAYTDSAGVHVLRVPR